MHGCPIEVVLELQVAPRRDESALCHFRLAWDEVETRQRHHCEASLRLPLVPTGQLSEFPIQAEVAQKRALKLSARLLSQAIEKISQKDRQVGRKALQAALDVLGEAPPCEEIAQARRQIESLVEQLERGDFRGASKSASYVSYASSLGSVSLHGWVKQFLSLPPDQRTAEKAEELRRASGWM